MSPSRVLDVYYALTFCVGTTLSVLLANWVESKDIGIRGAAVMILCVNVLFMMVLPLVLDWAERRYFKARFLLLEDLAETNPELAEVLKEQCSRLSIANLKLAVVQSSGHELFSYGLWKTNMRLIVPDKLLRSAELSRAVPSVEAELARCATKDRTLIFLAFAVVQEIIQLVLLYS